MPIVCVKSVKIYTGQKKFTRTCSWGSWQISGMIIALVFISSHLACLSDWAKFCGVNNALVYSFQLLYDIDLTQKKTTVVWVGWAGSDLWESPQLLDIKQICGGIDLGQSAPVCTELTLLRWSLRPWLYDNCGNCNGGWESPFETYLAP